MSDINGNFDIVRFYRALDGARQSQNLNWKEVALAAKVHPSTLSRMATGRRPDANSLALLAAWSGLNPADFVPGFRPAAPNVLAQISAFVHSDPQLSPEAAIAMDEMIRATYLRLAKRTAGSD